MGSQGIEIIQNRSAPARSAALIVAGTQGESGPSAPAVKGTIPGQPVDSSLIVSPATQAARDRDRLGILQQELLNEASVFQKKSNILRSPQLLAKLGAEDIAGLKAALVDHESNLRALNAEISRVKPGR